MGTMIALLLALQPGPTDPQVEQGKRRLIGRIEELRKEPEFGLWTLLSLDVPPENAAVRTLLEDALAAEPKTTRSAALQAMSLQLLDPAKHRVRIAHCARFVIDNPCDDGRWDAGKPVEPTELRPEPAMKPAPRAFGAPVKPVLPKVALSRRSAGAKTGDSRNSRWAAWGMLACSRAGVEFPAETMEKAAASWREGDHDPADVVTALSIQLSLGKKNHRKDPDVLTGVDRPAIGKPRTDPASLFLVRTAMLHFGSESLGGRDWWPEGVEILTAAQAADGGWGSLEDTAYAAVYLYLPRIRRDPGARRK